MKKLLLSITVLLCIVVAGAGIYWSKASSAVPVTLAEVKLAEVQPSIDTNGKIEAERIFEIRAPFSGVCRRILVSEGDLLKAGQPILVLDDASLKADLAAAAAEVQAAETDLRNVRRGAPPEELNQAQSDVERFRLELANARKTVESNEWLVKKNAISRWDLDQSRNEAARLQVLFDSAAVRLEDIKNRFGSADRTRAGARLEAAQTRVALLQQNISRSVVRAPAPGTLYRFEIKDGAFVNTGDLLGDLADLTRLRLRVFVDEPELALVAPDSSVLVQWDGRPGETWRGSVIRIPSQVVPRGTRSVGEVLCAVNDPSGTLVPNLNVDVTIRRPDETLAPALPREVVMQEARGHYVWVERDGRATKARVRTGRSTSRMVEITDGLKPGDRVIVPGETQIQEGAKVRIAE